MNPIKWKDGQDEIWDSLCIPVKRRKKLLYRFECIMHELHRPKENPEEQVIDFAHVAKLFIALAENEQELAFCAYVAGGIVADMKESDEWEEIDEEDY